MPKDTPMASLLDVRARLDTALDQPHPFAVGVGGCVFLPAAVVAAVAAVAAVVAAAVAAVAGAAAAGVAPIVAMVLVPPIRRA
jgi:hypothetical protein